MFIFFELPQEAKIYSASKALNLKFWSHCRSGLTTLGELKPNEQISLTESLDGMTGIAETHFVISFSQP